MKHITRTISWTKLRTPGAIEIMLSVLMLVFAVWFNLDLYKLEPTAKIDPNDNTFQFALVDRANTVWDYASRTCAGRLDYPICHVSYMADHWVHNWAQGYNLPFYYSHIPQIVIVGLWRILGPVLGGVTLFTFYHWVIYLLLCFFPVAVFAGIRAARFPWLIAGVGAVLATHISTDGLYGLDPTSFLWRGYGLSSQLFAMMFFPLALGLAYRFFTLEDPPSVRLSDFPSASDIVKAAVAEFRATVFPPTATKERLYTFWGLVLSLAGTISGHLGIGFMAVLSLGIMAIAPTIRLLFDKALIRIIIRSLILSGIRLLYTAGLSVFLLAYWILPTMKLNSYHNISYWDPIWKFDSFGWKEVMIRLFNGDLFDWGRFPAFTLLVLFGAMIAAVPIVSHMGGIGKKDTEEEASPETARWITRHSLFPFTLLFGFWVVMFFGRTTWGGLIDLIPGMTEFHISRFIVGIHAVGFFLAPIGIMGLAQIISLVLTALFATGKKASWNDVRPFALWTVTLALLWLVGRPIYRQTVDYATWNDTLIENGNKNYDAQAPDADLLMEELRKLPPARVFVGRGGGWGKDFRVAETEMFMHISTFGIPTALWLPETWSPNSDTEQYFSEDQAKDYDTYNLRWVAAPHSVTPQPFWKKIMDGPSWNIYEVPTTGYFTLATRTQTVVTDKRHFVNIVRQWIQSETPTRGLYPQITFSESEVPLTLDVPVIRMLDEVTYLTQSNQRLNIWANNPIYGGDPPKAQLIGPEIVDTDMRFSTTVRVEQGCKECYLVLKQTYHPNWKAWVNGRQVKPIAMFPFHIGIPLELSGVSEVTVSYEPHPWKVPLFLSAVVLVAGLWLYQPVRMKLMSASKKAAS